MSDIDLKGKKMWRVLRCSEDENEVESFSQQRRTTESCANKFGVTIIETKELPGYSATSGRQVEPILKLIQTKIDGADFDGFIVDAYSRFARSDVDEAKLYAACREANLLILTDKEGLMMGHGTWAKRGAATDQNEGYARDIGRHVNRATVDLILRGLIPPTLRIPWGIDREYYDPTGKPIFRVRRYADGRRAVLDPEPPHMLRHYILSGSSRLGIREEGHSYKLVPGDPELQAAVQDMFRMSYMDGVGARRICREFKRRNIPTQSGKPWTVSAIRKILRSPLWIGLSVGFMHSCGRHCERDKTGIKMFPMARRPGLREDKKPRKQHPHLLRPSKDWIIAKQPKLANFLNENVRALVQADWQYRFDHNGKPPKQVAPRRNLPPKSRYFLSGILRIKSDSMPMIGSDGPTRGDDAMRYYITRREVNSTADRNSTERVRADLVEEAVKDAIRTALSEFTITTEKVEKYIAEKQRELRGRTDDSPALQAEKAELEQWYRSAYSLLGTRGKELLLGEAQRVETRLHQIDVQLAELGAIRPEYLDCTVEEIINSVQTQFSQLQSVIDGKSSEALRNLAGALCSNLTFDPVSRVVDIEISLPSWVLTKRHAIVDRVGTEGTSDIRGFERTTSDGVVLLGISCKQSRLARNRPCFSCSRDSKKAA